MTASPEPQIPAPVRPIYDTIVSLTDRFCQAYLNPEYQALCRNLTGVLARKRPSPLVRSKPEAWASGIVRVIGWVNFLDDSSQRPHMNLTAIDQHFEISQVTGQAKSKAIRDMLKIQPLDPQWALPSRLEQNPVPWVIQINGLLLDARYVRREIQEEAYRKGLIPFIPSSRPTDSIAIRCDSKEVTGDVALNSGTFGSCR
jgi:hypothetical protein